MRSKAKSSFFVAVVLLALFVLAGCQAFYQLFGIKATLQAHAPGLTYDMVGSAGLKTIDITIQNNGPADATNVTYELVLNNGTTYSNSATVIYKAQSSGTISNGSSQVFTLNASDIYTYVNLSSNQVSAADGQFYLTAVAYLDNPADVVSAVNTQPIWWINNTFAAHAVTGQISANGNPLPNSFVNSPSSNQYTVYVGLVDPNNPIINPGPGPNSSFTPAQIFSGAWNKYQVSYNSSTGFATSINYAVGAPGGSSYTFYLGAFMDLNGDGKFNFDSGPAPTDSAVNYSPSGGVPGGAAPTSPDQLNLGTDQTGVNFHF